MNSILRKYNKKITDLKDQEQEEEILLEILKNFKIKLKMIHDSQTNLSLNKLSFYGKDTQSTQVNE